MAEWHNVRYEIVWNQDTESTQMPPWQSPSRLVLAKDFIFTDVLVGGMVFLLLVKLQRAFCIWDHCQLLGL
jgi:hypothetical protein